MDHAVLTDVVLFFLSHWCLCNDTLACFSSGADGGSCPSGGGAVAAGGGRFSRSAIVPVPGAPGRPQEGLTGSGWELTGAVDATAGDAVGLHSTSSV